MASKGLGLINMVSNLINETKSTVLLFYHLFDCGKNNAVKVSYIYELSVYS